MVNILLTTAILISSKLVAGASIPDTQTNISKRQDDDNRNFCSVGSVYQIPGKTLDLELYSQSYFRGRIGFKTVTPNRCYEVPPIDSSKLNGGTPGEGTITFCTGKRCDGSCRSESRQVWYTPADMQYGIGGLVNSVYWSFP
ncbi:hypothetical protein AX774_g6558 [Zancudomyces culisetae]|uniref:Uncharacterized protein n=1 Tax=Zancudomyces culisetae TaxID=1213189 RepID=A0A1R1PGE6_ZANCU|nr:hypothetical protein AX774_g6558 [Zancudomyces culisetae]|eukprot:OMH80017.1 hypothetical protein AX774_g6558 [Zancudomyces culisetae]